MKNLLIESFEIGKKALINEKPTPVEFYSADLLGNQIGESHIENEGDCGGAYIKGIKYRSPLYNYFKKLPNMELEGIASLSKDVYKGYILDFETNKIYNGQSHDRYKAFCDAVVTHLKSNGIQCYTYSYLT